MPIFADLETYLPDSPCQYGFEIMDTPTYYVWLLDHMLPFVYISIYFLRAG